MANPSIPRDINSAEPALRAEFRDYIDQLIDAAQVRTAPTSGNDLLSGTAANNTINGQDGNDVIYAYAGRDTVNAGSGNDYVLGMDGNDTLYGGTGNDYMFGETGDDRLYGQDGDDALFGGVGDDIVIGDQGNDYLYGNANDDRLTGGDGNDILVGGTGLDVLIGGSDNDELSGDGGADNLSGGNGNDFIEGGASADTLSGGADDDIYYYASPTHGNDRILDFTTDKDAFHFLGSAFGIEAGTNLDDGVTFIANAAPTSVVNQATVLYETDTGRLWFDRDGIGSGAAVLIARITGAPTVDHQDFIFV